ncbi:MAG: helix-turn-helix transcriptional regulator [Planctomycetes bacterium]|nr:helix-turn-helix transcriptional regulator [Planctomycetota bacterium]
MDRAANPHTPRTLRVLADLTQIELAERAGISDRTVRQLEDGDDVTLDTLRRVAAALGVAFDVLVAAHDVQRTRRGAA